MKRTVITILLTALVTSLCWYVVGGLLRGVEGLWLMSAIKAPGRMALDVIEADLQAGRLQVAKAKMAALRRHWEAFEREAGFRGQAIGNIMVTFGQIDSAAETNKEAEPDGPANGSQPIRSETNSTSPAAGSRR
jgi:hypothetical protein